MKILGIESSALTASVAVLCDNKIIAEESVTSSLTHSETLLPMIDRALKNVSLDITDIDAIAVSNGPGSFTGLRIGVGTAKGLSYGLKKGVCGVCTLKALSYNVITSTKPVCAIMDARRGEVYCGIYKFAGGKAETVKEPCAVLLEDVLNGLSEETIFVGDGVDSYIDILKTNRKVIITPENLRLQRASSVCLCARDENNFTDAQSLGITYLRLSQAEREYALKHNKENEL